MKISELDPFAGVLDGTELLEMSKALTAWESFSLELSDLVAYFDDFFILRTGDTMTGDFSLTGGSSGRNLVIQPSNGRAGVILQSENGFGVYNGFGTGNGQVGINNSYNKARNTFASPAVAITNDVALRFTTLYYGDTDYRTSGRFQHVLIEPTPSDTSMGSKWEFMCAPLGSTSISTATVTFENATGISMFGANPVIDGDRLHRLRVYTVAALPTAGTAGRKAFASNLRVFDGAGVQEGAGAGTGGEVVDNGTNWKIAGTNVTAVA